MGVRHLRDLRKYMEDNKDKNFSSTELRNILNHNYPQILDNLNYLMEEEDVVIHPKGEPKRYQWKNR